MRFSWIKNGFRGALLGVLSSMMMNSTFAQVVWFEKRDDQHLLFYLDKSKISAASIRFPEALVPAKNVYAGQLISMNDQELFEVLGDEYRIKKTDFNSVIFNVVKAGTVEKPFYQLVGGHNRFKRQLALDPDLKVKVRILEDLTGFSHLEQGELLSVFGNFWSPENPDGFYRRILVSETTPSPWRSIAKVPLIREKFSHLWNRGLAFTEVEFGRRVFNSLTNIGISAAELQTTAQVVETVKSISDCGILVRK